MRTLSAWIAGALALSTPFLFSACGNDSTPSAFRHYVALGDSYTAAPGVAPAPGSGDCGRSTANYPRLVASSLKAPLDDVSCSGATADDVLTGQRVTGQILPAQVDAVTGTTDLVTIGIGGNDLDLVGLATACVTGAAECAGKVSATQESLRRLPGRIEAVVRAVQGRAPKATVILVGYPTIISAQAPCPALPVPSSVTTAAIDINKQLAAAMKSAATTTKVRYIDLYRPTADHGLCGATPWIAGLDGNGAQPLHPTADEQKFVAQKVLAALA